MQKTKIGRKLKLVKHAVLSCILVLGLMTIVGTGGGGGGGGGTTGLTYTGLTTPAVIDLNNAQSLTTGVYTGGALGPELSFGAAQKYDVSGNSLSLFGIIRSLEKAFFQVDLTSRSYGTYEGAVSNNSTEYGICGGSRSHTISVNEQTGDFSGTLTFNNYCEGGATISGSVTFSGSIDLDTRELSNFLFSFKGITVTNGSSSQTLDGTIHFVLDPGSSSGGTITMNILMRDNSTVKVYRFDNFIMTAVDGSDGGGNFTQMTFTGRYFDPDYGYVDIITSPTPMKIYWTDEWPSEGVMVIDGANGVAGGSTRACLTVIDNTSYRVEADTNGNGTYDYNSGPLNWADL